MVRQCFVILHRFLPHVDATPRASAPRTRASVRLLRVQVFDQLTSHDDHPFPSPLGIVPRVDDLPRLRRLRLRTDQTPRSRPRSATGESASCRRNRGLVLARKQHESREDRRARDRRRPEWRGRMARAASTQRDKRRKHRYPIGRVARPKLFDEIARPHDECTEPRRLESAMRSTSRHARGVSIIAHIGNAAAAGRVQRRVQTRKCSAGRLDLRKEHSVDRQRCGDGEIVASPRPCPEDSPGRSTHDGHIHRTLTHRRDLFAGAAPLRPRATASSRSKMIASHSSVRAFSIARTFAPGMYNTDRRGRIASSAHTHGDASEGCDARTVGPGARLVKQCVV